MLTTTSIDRLPNPKIRTYYFQHPFQIQQPLSCLLKVLQNAWQLHSPIILNVNYIISTSNSYIYQIYNWAIFIYFIILILGLTSFAVSRSHILAVVALVIVSWVVNVLEAITNKVVSGLHFFNVTIY